jgi:16S rRNA A1518/A1519 N6-dimethyltransferase RsmA/KsgA/DIM1 with predicted DNA glycosylase/AP lyase activity
MVLVMPVELADRITAPVGSDAYGRLTVETALRAKSKVLFPLRRRDFEPRPEVDSCVLELRPKPFTAPKRLGALLDAAWDSKRKTLRHSLAPLAATLGVPPQAVTDCLAQVKAEQGRTAMDLSPYEYGVLAQALGTVSGR